MKRIAFALIGIIWILVIAAFLFSVNRNFSSSDDTGQTPVTSSSSSSDMVSTSTLTLTSTAFGNGSSIPSHFTCDGSQVNPPLSIAGVPEKARSLVLVMDDPDVPKQLRPDGVFDHWVLFNIPPQTAEIAEGMTAGMSGVNGAGKNEYAGPCPPPQYEPSEHRYIFRLYALDTMLGLAAGASKNDVQNAMEGHVLAQTQLIGRYKRSAQ